MKMIDIEIDGETVSIDIDELWNAWRRKPEKKKCDVVDLNEYKKERQND